jgi:carotenoid cleavage dioxygenase-like enzyme
MTQVTARRTDRQLLGYRSLEEERHIDRLTVEGEVPPWLAGSLLRTGPAKWDLGRQRLSHWFDGLAMLHRFSFAGGEVSYGNRFLRGKAFRAAQETGRIGYQEFATDPCRSLFRRLATLFVTPELSDNGAVNITRLGEQYMAMTETPMPVVFDPGTLESLGVQAPRPGTLPTAHPHRDAATGDLIGYTTKLAARSKYQLFTQTPGRAPRILASIAVREPAYLHSFALTERYAVIVAGPLVVKPLELAISGRPLIENFRWKPNRSTKIYVLDRHSGERVATLDAAPLFCFHHINAFDRDGEIVMDLIGYDDPSVIDSLYLDAIEAGRTSAPRPQRGATASRFEAPRPCRSSSSPTSASSCRASTTAATTPSLTATPTAPAGCAAKTPGTPQPTAWSSSTSKPARPDSGPIRTPTQANPSSSRTQTRAARTRASCSLSS